MVMPVVPQAFRTLFMLICFAESVNRVAARRLGGTAHADPLQQKYFVRHTAAVTEAAARPMLVGGTPVPRGDYRWLALAGTGGCAGVLVARDVVLTAAHCGNHFALGSKLRLGSVDRGAGGDTFAVEARMIHTHFGASPNKIANDLMLLRLAAPANSYPVLQINVDPSVPSIRTNLTVAGYGLTSWNGTASSVMLQATVIQYSCQQVYQRDLDPNVTLCAGSASIFTPAGTCAGDSGGPLLVESATGATQLLVGITSFGADGSCGRVPSGFVRLSGHARWLRKNLCALTKYPPSYLCQT